MPSAGEILGLVIVVAMSILCGILAAGAIYSIIFTDTHTIVVQEKLGAHGTEGQYLIIDTDDNVYSVEDNYLLGLFDASNRYARLHEGKTVEIQTRGIRFPLLSWYPNIVNSTELQSVSLEKPCPANMTIGEYLANTSCSIDAACPTG
jgi:hypothetical protein